MLGVFQKLIASKANDVYGFMLLWGIVESLPLAAYQQYMPTVWQLLFTRLQVSWCWWWVSWDSCVPLCVGVRRASSNKSALLKSIECCRDVGPQHQQVSSCMQKPSRCSRHPTLRAECDGHERLLGFCMQSRALAHGSMHSRQRAMPSPVCYRPRLLLGALRRAMLRHAVATGVQDAQVHARLCAIFGVCHLQARGAGGQQQHGCGAAKNHAHDPAAGRWAGHSAHRVRHTCFPAGGCVACGDRDVHTCSWLDFRGFPAHIM